MTVPLLKLLQITSPGLPVGAYSYSQALEWVVEAGWVNDRESFVQWLTEQLNGTLAQQELPILKRLYEAYGLHDARAVQHWDEYCVATRETSELRLEELHRGRALRALIVSMDIGTPVIDPQSQLGGFAFFCNSENIPLTQTLQGNAYSWLENQVAAGIKLVPLGQTEGQSILYSFGHKIEQAVTRALSICDDDIGYSSPGLAMASSLHETQYCRLFRS